MQNKLRILHFQLLPILSGVQNVSLNEIKNLKNEFDFEVACSYPGPFSEKIEELGIKTHFFPELKHHLSLKWDLLIFFKLLKFFKKNNFDIVHTHSSKPGFLGRVTAKLSGCKNVMHTVHGFAFGSSENLLKQFLFYVLEFIAARFTDRILVMNQADFNFCNKRLFIPIKKIKYLANGIQDDYFNQNKISNNGEKLALENTLNIVFVGRLSRQKNPKILLHAFNEMPLDLKEKSNLYFIGDGELKNEMEQIVEKLKLDNKVIFLGWVSDAARLIKQFDVFVLPSLYEGMPLSIIEAMASKVVVIASDISGNRDLIENNKTGKLFCSNNVRDLTQVLRELISDDEKRTFLAGNGYKNAFNNYRLTEHCKNLSNIYVSCLN